MGIGKNLFQKISGAMVLDAKRTEKQVYIGL
jgi:hypothetical protein